MPQEYSSNWKKFLKENPEVKSTKKRKRSFSSNSTETSENKIKKMTENPSTSSPAVELCKQNSFKGPTKVMGIDCEMIEGGNDKHDMLARVSLVNCFGHCIYDKYVKPTDVVTDYRTKISGIRPSDLDNAESFTAVRGEVRRLLHNRILVGHSLKHDLQALEMNHPPNMRRDTSTYPPFMQLNEGKTPSLSMLADKILNIKIQEGEHNPVIDAQAAMKLYMMHKSYWK